MKEMLKLQKDFHAKHRKGSVTNVNSYSFTFVEDKNGKQETTVYMKSYFAEVGQK